MQENKMHKNKWQRRQKAKKDRRHIDKKAETENSRKPKGQKEKRQKRQKAERQTADMRQDRRQKTNTYSIRQKWQKAAKETFPIGNKKYHECLFLSSVLSVFFVHFVFLASCPFYNFALGTFSFMLLVFLFLSFSSSAFCQIFLLFLPLVFCLIFPRNSHILWMSNMF